MVTINNGILELTGTIQHKRGTSAAWATTSYVPKAGELAIATDTGRVKVGDGLRSWNELQYVSDVSGMVGTYSKKLTANDISCKKIELPSESGAREIISVTLNGLEAIQGEDYRVSGGVMSWDGLELNGLVQAGDRLTLKYK